MNVDNFINEIGNSLKKNEYNEKNNLIYKLMNENKELKEKYDNIIKDKENIELNHKNEMNNLKNIIENLTSSNDTLNKQINSQITLYKKLLNDFSTQQILLENKSLKLTNQIKQINKLIENIGELKLKNVQLEKEIISCKKLMEEKNFIYYQDRLDTTERIVKSNIIDKYIKEIETLKTDNKLLKQENINLCKDNVLLSKKIDELKKQFNITKSIEYNYI